jgi:hypothetical protein
MSPEQAIAELNAMPKGGDEEILHDQADKIVCEVLKSVGCREVAEAFEAAQDRVGFWYA